MHILELKVERNSQQAQNADDPLVIHIIEGRKIPRNILQKFAKGVNQLSWTTT